MRKEDNKPPAQPPEEYSDKVPIHKEKVSKRPERNRVPDYEALFVDSSDTVSRNSGFMRKVFRKDRARIILVTLLYIIQALPLWIMPLVTGDVIDTVTNRPDGYITRIIIDAAIFAVILIQNVPTTIFRAGIVNRMLRSSVAGIRAGVIRKLQRLSITYHREMENGKIQAKLLRDIDNVYVYYLNIVQGILPALITAIISVGISVYKSPIVTLFFVFIVPLNVLNALIFRKKMKVKNYDFRVKNEKMSSHFTNMLQMMTLTKSHGLENVESHQLKKHIDNLTQSGLKLDRTATSFSACTWVLSNLLSGVCLFFCVFLAIKGFITVGEVVLFQSLFASINSSVMNLVNAYPAIISGKESVNSLSEIMRSEDMEHSGGNKELPAINGEVTFENVCYRYPDGDKNVIKDFNLHVSPGECIAIVGSSGSGKSTVINLIIGLLEPSEGRILIDGIPLDDVSRQNYRHFISVVPQNSILFSGSIRENITYGLSSYNEEQLYKAVTDADIPEFLPSLPNGLDSQVGEHGDKLSGGQKQRICIARALIRNPKILIMDEATSALDNVAEFHVQKAIEKMVKTSTTFIVAHRLSTIRNADRIVVMENGVAVEIGSYDELMALGGRFCELEKLSRIREEEAA